MNFVKFYTSLPNTCEESLWQSNKEEQYSKGVTVSATAKTQQSENCQKKCILKICD